MKMTYSIKTVLRKDKTKADGMIPVYYAVRVGRTTSRIPTGKSIALKDWDGKNDCPKRNNKINDLLNDHFTKIMSDWKFAMLQKESMGKTITLSIAQEQFKAKPKVTFYSFFAEQIELWQNQKTASTLRTYRSTLNVLKAFDPKANFGDLDLTWIEKFDLYLSNVRKNSVGGRFGRHKTLRAILHAAVKKGLIPASAHPYEHFSIKAAKGNRQFLTVEELQKVIKVNLPEEDIMLEKVKDLFLFSAFTGLRYSDVQNLQWQHINPESIEINMKMKKTGSMTEVPIISDAMKIIEKYGKHSIKSPSASILPQISNQVVNRNLKLIMERARIKKSISFHCARHTFATLANQAGTNIVHLQKLLGHAQIADTMIYTHLNKADLHNSMDKLQSLYKKAL